MSIQAEQMPAARRKDNSPGEHRSRLLPSLLLSLLFFAATAASAENCTKIAFPLFVYQQDPNAIPVITTTETSTTEWEGCTLGAGETQSFIFFPSKRGVPQKLDGFSLTYQSSGKTYTYPPAQSKLSSFEINNTCTCTTKLSLQANSNPITSRVRSEDPQITLEGSGGNNEPPACKPGEGC